eukprot:TRINITY_DN5471_c0_g1_i1.p1 TRINITY_DN5471_c0_g1~~TRINITY_DN5471_c0_g1_i1.p1  ORF type:complete len:332 (+),score=93.20 TRINITY_DN5471_c0_g1_i1:170-1165(+)
MLRNITAHCHRLILPSVCSPLVRIQQKQYSTKTMTKRVTWADLSAKYKNNTPITMVTAYDYTSAYLVDQTGIDILLVGDSLGMVMMGRQGTNDVTMDEMIHHCKSVSLGSSRCFLIGDMPFGSFEASTEDAIRNACRLVKEGGMMGVKVEGGRGRCDTIKAITCSGIPVIGHIGLTPQTSTAMEGYKVQGKTAKTAIALLDDAIALQEAGCIGIVLEMVPSMVSHLITSSLLIPSFGIGAGSSTSGQVLVYHDMLGLYPNFSPKFCKQYANLSITIREALTTYKDEVVSRSFPTEKHSFTISSEEWDKVQTVLSDRKNSSATSSNSNSSVN